MKPEKIKAKFRDQQLEEKYDGLNDKYGFFFFNKIGKTCYLKDSEDRFHLSELFDIIVI